MRRDGYFAEEIKFSESFKAAELLGKHYGLFGEKQEKKPVKKSGVTIIDNIPEGRKNVRKK